MKFDININLNQHITKHVYHHEAGEPALSKLINQLGDKIMTSFAEVKTANSQEVKMRMDGLEKRIADLIAAGGGATPAELDELMAAVQGIFRPANT